MISEPCVINHCPSLVSGGLRISVMGQGLDLVGSLHIAYLELANYSCG